MGALLIEAPVRAPERIPAPPRRRSRLDARSRKILTTIVVLAVAVSMVVPFIYMISASFRLPADVGTNPLQLIPEVFTLNNYATVFQDEYFLRWMLNTFVVVISVTVLGFLITSMAAFGFARLRFRGSNLLFIYVIAGMMVPGDLTIMARYIEFKAMGLIDTLPVLILPALFNGWLVFLLRQFYMSIPQEIVEAARLDGCGNFRIWALIFLPLSKAAAATVAVFSFIWTWNLYLEPSVLISSLENQVISVGINFFAQTAVGGGVNVPVLMAGACVSTIPVVILFLLLQDRLVEGIASTGVKG